MSLHLHDFYRSSAAYRVRIALNLKGLEAERTYVNLTAGEQHAEGFQELSPSGLMPVLQDGDVRVYQSLAIIDYLDAKYPEPSTLPADPAARARVLGLALAVAADTHPLTNVRVLNFVEKEMGAGKDGRAQWIEHWCRKCFAGLETRLVRESETGVFMHGDSPTLADICLIPQMFFARRFDLDLSDYPTLLRIEAACNELPAFAAAHPSQQPDAA
ncbi:MAG: maleylacetoacetate isomerase [Minwuia sp.]|uniref:maleylacetoacetate isomerase n=1 Tax=Minwuia sp. TaxID=2493630 RepID=UPI003A8471E6